MNEVAATRVQAAPGATGCCDGIGVLVQIARMPLTLERLIALAVARGEGSHAHIRERVRDMIAGGLLIELE